jgi:membrane-associated phospholipid phosphatase
VFALFFLLFRYIFRLKEAANRFLYLFLAVAGSGLIVDVLKFVFGRARPKLFFEQNIYGIKFFGTEHLYYSLPSGHSATAFSLALSAALFFPRFALALFGVAVLIAFSRIAVSAHYLSDTVAGAYIGVVFALWLKRKMIEKGVKF